MKKIIFSCFMVLFTATILFNNAIGNAYNNNRLHQECVDSRWKFITYEGDKYYFYDSQTLNLINKYIPFVDKKVEIWILLHDHKPFSFDFKTWRPRCDTKTLYLINLDDRTYQFKTTKTVITKSVVPGSAMEKVLVRCQELYDE